MGERERVRENDYVNISQAAHAPEREGERIIWEAGGPSHLGREVETPVASRWDYCDQITLGR